MSKCITDNLSEFEAHQSHMTERLCLVYEQSAQTLSLTLSYTVINLYDWP